MSLAQTIILSRRLFVLRLLVETGSPLNDSVIWNAALQAGVGEPSRDTIRQDLDILREAGCITEEWLDRFRIASVTERGEDAAYGRVTVEGVEHSRWRR